MTWHELKIKQFEERQRYLSFLAENSESRKAASIKADMTGRANHFTTTCQRHGVDPDTGEIK